MSTRSPVEFPQHLNADRPAIEQFTANPLPRAHLAEADVYARHDGLPGHDQARLEEARVLLVGAGGINSWTGVALARSGIGTMTIVDPDVVDRTNLSRQLFGGDDLGQPKATQLARNLLSHATGPLSITAISARFEIAVELYPLPADVLMIGVDSNPCRLRAVREARRRRIPAVFSLLSRDGMRWHTFLQGSQEDDACLWCALPNLDPTTLAPCVPAVVTSAMGVAASSVFLVHRALMGWPDGGWTYNWREADLMGLNPERVARVSRRRDCPACGPNSGL